MEEGLGLTAGGARCAVDIGDIHRVDQTWPLRRRNRVGVAGHRLGCLALGDIRAVQLTRFEAGFGIPDGRVLQIEGNVEAIRPSPDSGPVGKVVSAGVRIRDTWDDRAHLILVCVPSRAGVRQVAARACGDAPDIGIAADPPADYERVIQTIVDDLHVPGTILAFRLR